VGRADIVSLKAMVDGVTRNIESRRGAGDRTAPLYFLVVGAGVSVPSIPSSDGMIRDCMEKMGEKRGSDPIEVNDSSNYSSWMESAYPERDLRQEYISGKVRAAHLTRASFRLAHLLAAGGDNGIARLVVTPNFDDLIERGLEVLNHRPIVCDHYATTARVQVQSRERLQIVHIHGSHLFYDCCNLKDEIQDRSFTAMRDLLNRILNQDHVPIVVGYSGWSDDVFMLELKARLANNTLPRKLYWVCHRLENLAMLPDWLRDSSDVRFVLPDDGEAGPVREGTERPTSNTAQAPPKSQGDPSSENFEPQLPADAVFEALIRALDIPPPGLATDPVKFVADHLERQLPPGEKRDDVLSLYPVVRRLRHIVELERRGELPRPLIEGVWQAQRRADHESVVLQATKIPIASLDANDRTEFFEALFGAAESLGFPRTVNQVLRDALEPLVACLEQLVSVWPDSVEGLLYKARALRFVGNLLFKCEGADHIERALKAYDGAIASVGENDDPGLLFEVAISLRNKGIVLGERPDGLEQAVAAYDEVVRRFGDSENPDVLRQVAMALVNKGFDLSKRPDSVEQAVAACDEVVRRFGDSENPELLREVASALLTKGNALGGRPNASEQSVAAYDEVVRRFDHSENPELQRLVAMALGNKGIELSRRPDGSEQAVAAFDEVVRRFGESENPPLQRQVATALVNKGFELGQRPDGSEQAVAAYDEVVGRFGDSQNPELQSHVAVALVSKGDALGERPDGSEQSVAAYDEVLRRFGDSRDPELLRQVAVALVNKGVELSRRPEDSEQSVAAYDEVLRRFGDSDDLELQSRVAVALVNKGVELSQRPEDSEQAVAAFDEVVRRFGDSKDPELLRQVAMALVNRGVELSQLPEDSEQAVAAFDEVVRRFGDSKDIQLLRQVALALVGKGFKLSQRPEDSEQAVAAYDEVLRRFGESDDLELQSHVAVALANKGDAVGERTEGSEQ
jgi:tetratricopeptide (TPR) repeat protein